MTELNAEQEQARLMARRTAEVRGVAIVAGPAGTGKSTLLRAICQDLGRVVLLAPTNRAAQRAAALSGQAATTIHGWLYNPMDTDKGVQFVRRPMHKIEIPTSRLIVIDEASMIGPDVWYDIWQVVENHDVGILLVGDPFQLPPVVPDGMEFSVFESDFRTCVEDAGWKFERVDLKHVFRQALESPIIRACTELRQYPTNWRNAVAIMSNEKSINNDNPKGYAFSHPSNVAARVQGLLEDGIDHCVVCYTNEKRRQINRDVRLMRQLGDADPPQPGEPLLVRRNCKKAAVSNGEIITFTGFVEPDRPVKLPSQYRFLEVNGALCLTSVDMIATGNVPDRKELAGLQWPFIEANFGYATTAHASQGHEFDWVIVNWESILMAVYHQPIMRVRWLYTSFSRAKKKLMIGGLAD